MSNKLFKSINMGCGCKNNQQQAQQQVQQQIQQQAQQQIQQQSLSNQEIVKEALEKYYQKK